MRKWSEFLIFILYFLVPYFDIFRIDIPSGYYYWFTIKFPFSHALPLVLTILFLVMLVIGLSFFKPRMFCSHLCPHNTAAQWMRTLIKYKLDYPFGIILTPIISFTMLCYFVAPATVWSALTEGTSQMILVFYIAVTLFIGFLLLKLRSNFCKNICPYGIFQQLVRPEKPTRTQQIVVSVLLVLLASAMVTSAVATSTTEISLGTANRIKTGDMMTYTYNLKLVNNSNAPETFVIKFYEFEPVGKEFKDPIVLQPGEEKTLPFAFQAKTTQHVKFTVHTEHENRTETFQFTLAGI
jgi:hypothetical protein